MVYTNIVIKTRTWEHNNKTQYAVFGDTFAFMFNCDITLQLSPWFYEQEKAEEIKTELMAESKAS